ncbi:hypothetical protein CR513_20351, partial [Mucuna pruriens]
MGKKKRVFKEEDLVFKHQNLRSNSLQEEKDDLNMVEYGQNHHGSLNNMETTALEGPMIRGRLKKIQEENKAKEITRRSASKSRDAQKLGVLKPKPKPKPKPKSKPKPKPKPNNILYISLLLNFLKACDLTNFGVKITNHDSTPYHTH